MYTLRWISYTETLRVDGIQAKSLTPDVFLVGLLRRQRLPDRLTSPEADRRRALARMRGHVGHLALRKSER